MMIRVRIAGLSAVLALALAATASANPKPSVLATAGWNGGPGGHAAVTFDDFAQGLPLGLRVGVGYSGCEPGDAWAARRVFINANTNGTPQSNGRRWDYRLDGVWRTSWRGIEHLDVVAGPRVSRFSGQFDFIGGNEFFNVVSTQWGLGTGAEASFRMSDRSDFVVGLGFDWFFNSRMTGHDTAYLPDGTSVNAIDDYTWADADKAIHQPRLTPRVMLGLQRRLGH
jgi:hypothetical protein